MKLWRGATYGDALALGQVQAGIKGRTEAAREIREATEGKASQRVHVSGPVAPKRRVLSDDYIRAVCTALGVRDVKVQTNIRRYEALPAGSAPSEPVAPLPETED